MCFKLKKMPQVGLFCHTRDGDVFLFMNPIAVSLKMTHAMFSPYFEKKKEEVWNYMSSIDLR